MLHSTIQIYKEGEGFRATWTGEYGAILGEAVGISKSDVIDRLVCVLAMSDLEAGRFEELQKGKVDE